MKITSKKLILKKNKKGEKKLTTHLLRTGNMLLRVSEIKIKYAQENPVETKS